MDFIIKRILEKAITEADTISPEQLRQVINDLAEIFLLILFLIAFIEVINLWMFYRLEKKIKKISKKLEKSQKNS